MCNVASNIVQKMIVVFVIVLGLKVNAMPQLHPTVTAVKTKTEQGDQDELPGSEFNVNNFKKLAPVYQNKLLHALNLLNFLKLDMLLDRTQARRSAKGLIGEDTSISNLVQSKRAYQLVPSGFSAVRGKRSTSQISKYEDKRYIPIVYLAAREK